MQVMGCTRVLYVSLFFAIFSLNASTLVQETVKETNRKSHDETGYVVWSLAKETLLERRENLPFCKQDSCIVTNEGEFILAKTICLVLYSAFGGDWHLQ